jgi:type I restriction enzyme S subunit
MAAYLEALQTRADAIRAAQLETQRELEALMPAVLDRAFRGEL